MSDIEEIKGLIRLHIATQAVNQQEFLAVLDEVRDGNGAGPHSWVGEWSRLGESLVDRGKLIEAVQAFNFARFPFVDGPERQTALERCIEVFAAFRELGCPDARRVEIECRGVNVPIYVRGVPATGVPLVVVMGGIVSLKEQWYRTLLDGPKLGFAVAVADFPGVGENPLLLEHSSCAYLGSILDYFERQTPELAAIVVAISFSGQLALRQAARDRRIRGVITAGAPLRHFFTDAAWFRDVPETTKRTLVRVCGVTREALFEHLGELAVGEEELERIDVPVHNIVSLRDDIVPAADALYLERHVRQLSVLRLDDIHGAPHFVGAVRKYIALGLVRIGFPKRRWLGRVLAALVRVELWRAELKLLAKRMWAREARSAELAARELAVASPRDVVEGRGRP